MRAVVVRQYGGPDALELVEVPVLAPGPEQVRIKVTAAAVNPIDVAVREGVFAGLIGERATVGIGWDVAGTVDAIGAGVTDFAVGDAAIGLLDVMAVDLGTYAEYVVLDAAAVAPAPASADPAAAATLPLNALTAEQALDLLDLPAGSTLLVTGAAGGLGGYVVELGARQQLRMVAAAGAADEALVRGLGAQLFVPRTEALADAARAAVPGGVDAVLDAAAVGPQALAAVRDGGAFVAVSDPAEPPSERGIAVQTVHVHHDGPQLARLARLVDAGEITLRVATTLSLEQAADAHRLLQKGGLRGRIVLVP